jgi:hypothetical protein
MGLEQKWDCENETTLELIQSLCWGPRLTNDSLEVMAADLMELRLDGYSSSLGFSIIRTVEPVRYFRYFGRRSYD